MSDSRNKFFVAGLHQQELTSERILSSPPVWANCQNLFSDKCFLVSADFVAGVYIVAEVVGDAQWKIHMLPIARTTISYEALVE